MTVADPQDEPLARLWDELADFDAGDTAGARGHLMAVLCDWLKAKNAGWIASMRTGFDAADPLQGWRVGATVYLNEEPLNQKIVAELKARWTEKREADPDFIRNAVPGAGERFRAFSFRAAMPPQWFKSPHYKLFYAIRGIHDSAVFIFPLNADAESTFMLHRAAAHGDFTPEDLALASRALRGIKWFHRQLMLNHGLLVASTPLSPAERDVLQALLTDASEKEIARRLDLAASTVHQYVVRIYRKFGVKSRAGLMSLWLNRAG